VQNTNTIVCKTKNQKNPFPLESQILGTAPQLHFFLFFAPPAFFFLSGDSPSMEKWTALLPHLIVFHELTSVVETGGNSEAEENTVSVTHTSRSLL